MAPLRRQLRNAHKSPNVECIQGYWQARRTAPSRQHVLTLVIPGAGINSADPGLERDPPAAPTPVTFPQIGDYTSRPWTEASPPPRIQPLFARVLKPSHISQQHVEAFNARIEPPCRPEDLIPLAPDGSSYLPPLTADQAITPATYANAVNNDDGSARKRKEFDERLAELRVDNDTGFRVITRTTKPGVKAPRLATMRKFWEGVESVAQYWDTSLDQYYEDLPAKLPSDEENSAKRQRLNSTQPGPTSVLTLQTNSSHFSTTNSGRPTTSGLEGDASSDRIPEKQPRKQSEFSNLEESRARDERSDTATPEPRPCLRYKGRRTASGRDMPDQFRADTVKAFVEGIVWPFTCITAPPRHTPLVRINKLNLPVRQTAAVYRRPADRLRQRSGWLEGPLLAVQCRPDTDFDSELLTEPQKEAKARLDLIRELGGLLLLAEERQRQGKTETRSGEGEWWTSKPRWGGGPGGAIEENMVNDDAEVKDVLQLAEAASGGARRQEDGARRPKRKTPATLWKDIRPASKQWDPKTDYEAIGKNPRSAYDEVSFSPFFIKISRWQEALHLKWNLSS